MPTRWRRAAASGSSSTPPRSRRCPRALELAEAGVRTGGDRRNRDYAGPHVESTRRRRPRGARLRSADGRRPARLAARGQGGRARGDVRRPQGSTLYRVGSVRRRLGRRRSGEPALAAPARSLRTLADARPGAIDMEVVSPRRFRPARGRRGVAMFFVVTRGAVVRLTASGLGCDNWPRCGDSAVPDEGQPARDHRVQQPHGRARRDRARADHLAREPQGAHGLPARLAWRPRALPRDVAQIPLGGVTIMLDLHPLAVMSHFLLALRRARGCRSSSSSRRGAPSRAARRRSSPAGCARGRLGGVCRLAAALVVTGAVATASGPHPGAAKGVDAPRHLDRRHGVRPRARGSRVRDRLPRARALPLAQPRRALPGVFRVWAPSCSPSWSRR